MLRNGNRRVLRVALISVCVAAGWMVLWDALWERFVGTAHLRVAFWVIKGLAFVLVSGVAVYLALRSWLRRWKQELARLQQTEAEMVKVRAYYQKLLETSSDGIHVLSETGELLEANAAFYKLLGYPPENPPKLKVSDWEAKWSAEEMQARVKRHLQEPELFETVHRRRDGRLIDVEVNTRRIELNGQGCLYSASRDITERKRAESVVRENQEKFLKIFQSSPIAVSVSTMIEGRYLDVNDEFLRMVQRPREEVIGHTALEIQIWESTAQRNATLEQAREFGSARNIELAVHTGAGQVRQVLWSAEAVVIGGENCLLGTALDITDRKEAEENLRESEERYRQLFELESDAVMLIDWETHRLVDVNQSALRLYGYTREEFLQMKVESVSAEPEVTDSTVAAEKAFTPLRWHRRRNGERFAVEITANVIIHQGRRMELATLRDITVRQQVMDMLAEATDQLLEAQRLAGLGSYEFDVANGRWKGSEVLGEILGLAEPGLSYDTDAWLGIVHPEDRAALRRHLFEEVLKSRQPFDRGFRIVRANDREERWVHGLGRLVLNERGEVTRLVGVIQDITERKRDQERMNVHLSALTAAANVIVITNRDGKIEWVNPAFTKLTGYSAEEAVGNTPRLLNSHRQPPAFYANLWVTILTGNVWHGELVNRRKNGECYTEDMTITPVRGADGQITHFVAVKQDVTEQRAMEKRMLQAQKMEAIGTLAGGIAHDFNNILAAMFGYAYLLQQDTEGNSGAQENVEEILKATGRAKDLVQQILTFSQQREQKPEVVHLDTVVKEAIKFLRASMPAQIKIEMNLAADAPAVLADPTQIYQVTINLATNALHAMEGRPGRLTVALEGFEPDAKFIHSHPEFKPLPYARLTVADTGQGMDAKTLERIFEPFFTTKPVGKGTGLGLAVVHGIVQTHNGAITVESEVDRGSTFRLYFPGQKQKAAPPADRGRQAPAGAGQRILLLDDEPALTSALQRVLARLNYQVTTTNSARESLQWCRRDPAQFDLVITDLTMPEMTGLEVARQLRALRPDLPVILTSGFSADINQETLAAAGVCELLEKPISRITLADVIHRVLARHGKGTAPGGVPADCGPVADGQPCV
jgi:PAS domain S-box-containing protein